MAKLALDPVPPEGLIYYWFIQYNPLYFFSALCVLAGMYLVDGQLGGGAAGEAVLAGIIQLYELLLIAGAALLFRTPGQRRPGVLLGLAAAFFMLDPTLRTEGVAMAGPSGLAISAALAILLVVKIAALRATFRLTLPPAILVPSMVGGLTIVGMPHLLSAPQVDPEDALIVAAWIGAGLVAAAIFLPKAARCTQRLGEWGETVLRRAMLALPWLWVGFYLYHLLMWTGIHDMAVGLQHAVPFLLLVLPAFRSERGVWAATVVVLSSAVVEPQAASVLAFATALVVAALGWRRGMARLYVAATLCVYAGFWTWGLETLAMPEPNLSLNLVAAAAMLLLAWRCQLYTALAAAPLCLAPGAGAFLPSDPFQWGLVLLGLGFIKLGFGFAINWWTPLPRKPS